MSGRGIVVVGAGFAGLGMAIRLKQAKFHDFTILEQSDHVGGTWRDNRYPGAACDVQSHLYSFSFAPNPNWSRMFAPQPEILAYLDRCADEHGIRPHLRLGTAVKSAIFDDATGRWKVTTSRGDTIDARVLISACGGLNRPAYPNIPGLDQFQGKTFHSARWDHATSLVGKTVGVIGTGASAIQIVPSIAADVARLHVFQRTPPWILPKPDREMAPRERALFRRIPAMQKLLRLGIYLRNEAFATGFLVDSRVNRLATALAHRYLESSVRDPVLRDKLLPRYAVGCKRILLSNDYYPAISRDNVELVTERLERVSHRGVVTDDGRERALDALVLCTGFHAADAIAPFEIRGRGGRDLDDVWRDGAEAFLGTTVSGFPNLFFLIGPNTALGHNSLIYMMESQIEYVLSCVETMRAWRLKIIDVKKDAQARFNERLHARFPNTVWSAGGCSNWYRTSSGKNTTLWPGFTFEFRYRTRRFDPKAYEVVPDTSALVPV